MGRIAVIYFSATGTTASLAGAIGAGAAECAEVAFHRITGADIVAGRFTNRDALAMVDAATAVVFGSPTFMGGPAAEFKAFADATSDRWTDQRWSDKVAAGFTTGACANGDQGHTLSYLSILAAQHGMMWCNLDIPGGQDRLGRNALGAQLGLATRAVDGVVTAGDLATARHLGRRLALVAARLARGA